MPDENGVKKVHESVVFWVIVLAFLGGVMLGYSNVIERQARSDEQITALKERLVSIEHKIDTLVGRP